MFDGMQQLQKDCPTESHEQGLDKGAAWKIKSTDGHIHNRRTSLISKRQKYNTANPKTHSRKRIPQK